MGYNLMIGEAKIVVHWEDRDARMGAAFESFDKAPLNSGGDHSNRISAGYLAWTQFTREVGLYSVFYAPRCPKASCHGACSTCGGRPVWWTPEGGEREGLLRHLPGAAELEECHLVAFQQARERWMARPEEEREVGVADGVDWVQRRLDWLVWWTEWALRACAHPTMGNS